MIATETRSVVESNINLGRTVRAGVNDEDLPFIMGLFTDLYKDRVLACVREYATNARDAHVQAGCPDRPIEITLPGSLSQFYVIRDYGTTMMAPE